MVEVSPRMASRKNDRQWDAIIRPRNGWFDINFRELLRYRDLIFLLVKRNVTLLYKQTVLGPAWILIQAMLHSLVFTVVFGGIWLHYKNRRDLREEMKRMDLQDLE